MARNHNLYCPECGEPLKYNQSKKSYYCINPNCPRYNGSLEKATLIGEVEKLDI